MIDFTSCEINRYRAYGGANGNKINVLYGGKSYVAAGAERVLSDHAAGAQGENPRLQHGAASRPAAGRRQAYAGSLIPD